jgi:hypothetical protein
MWKVISSGAYSITRQSKLIADVLDAEFVGINVNDNGNKIENDDKYIVFGNPSGRLNMILTLLREKVKILYLVAEGRFIDTVLVNFVKNIKPIVISPSYASKQYIEMSGIKVDGVIYHMIEKMPEINVSEKTIPFLYISGYMLRKFPRNLDPLLEKISNMLVLVTTKNNPYVQKHRYLALFSSDYDNIHTWAPQLTDELKYKLYASSKFYLNLSDAEGFGLTPLEACYYGAIPIVVDIPVFRETLGDNAIYVPHNGTIFEEFFSPIMIKHFQYDPIEFYNKAIQSYLFYDEYKYLSKKCIEHAKEWNNKNNYLAFKKYME